jgi:hypothetical protein
MEAIASNTYLTRLSPPFKNLNSRKGRFVKAKSFSAGGQFEFTLTRMAQGLYSAIPQISVLIRPPMP